MERYKGYGIEYVDHLGTYRVYDLLSQSGSFAYCDTMEEAKRGIDENLEARQEVSFDNGYGTTYRFIIVDKIPDSRYCVWNIPDHRINGFLPLCLDPVRLNGTYDVDVTSLAAIDMSDRPELLHELRDAASYGVDCLYKAQKYYDIEPKNQIKSKQREYARKLLPVFEELSERFYTPEYESVEPDEDPDI